jgi:hypothetical protein
VKLDVGTAGSRVGIVSERSGKAHRRLANGVFLRRGRKRRPEVERRRVVAEARPRAETRTLADAAEPQVHAARRVQEALDQQVVFDLEQPALDRRSLLGGGGSCPAIALGVNGFGACGLGAGRDDAAQTRDDDQPRRDEPPTSNGHRDKKNTFENLGAAAARAIPSEGPPLAGSRTRAVGL